MTIDLPAYWSFNLQHMNPSSFIPPWRTCGCAWLLVAVVTLSAPQVRAQNLLEGKPVLVTADKAAETKDWVAEVTFEKATRHDLRLRVEFELSAIPTSPVFTLKKPPNISAWTLNGRDLIGPPKDMFYPELEGIPVSALKAGKFLVFKTDDKQCELKAWTFGGLQTPDNERKLELVDTRVWKARKQAGGSATQ